MGQHLNALMAGAIVFTALMSPWALGQDSRVETTSVPAILENLDEIDAALTAGDAGLAGLNERDRRELSVEQAKVRKLLAGKDTLEALSGRDRLVAYNALENIHGILNGKREERVVCRRDHVVGSNRPQTSCMSAKEREQARNSAVQAMGVRSQMLKQEGIMGKQPSRW